MDDDVFLCSNKKPEDNEKMNESLFKAIKEELLNNYDETNIGNDIEIEKENILF